MRNLGWTWINGCWDHDFPLSVGSSQSFRFERISTDSTNEVAANSPERSSGAVAATGMGLLGEVVVAATGMDWNSVTVAPAALILARCSGSPGRIGASLRRIFQASSPACCSSTASGLGLAAVLVGAGTLAGGNLISASR